MNITKSNVVVPSQSQISSTIIANSAVITAAPKDNAKNNQNDVRRMSRAKKRDSQVSSHGVLRKMSESDEKIPFLHTQNLNDSRSGRKPSSSGAKMVGAQNSQSSRDESPDSYTEPVRLAKSKSDHQVKNGDKKYEQINTLNNTATVHKVDLKENEEEVEFDESKEEEPIRPQTDWMLIDPQNEYDSILSNIAAKKATFV